MSLKYSPSNEILVRGERERSTVVTSSPDSCFSSQNFASTLSTTGNNLTDILPVDDDFNVTQFYHMGVAPTTFATNSFLGGTQDNGTPYWSSGSPTGPSNSIDVSGGDNGER